MSTNDFTIDECVSRGPLSELEKLYIEEYLKNKGYTWEDFHKLPSEEAKLLMKEACTYTSLKLAELESKAQFRREIHTSS